MKKLQKKVALHERLLGNWWGAVRSAGSADIQEVAGKNHSTTERPESRLGVNEVRKEIASD